MSGGQIGEIGRLLELWADAATTDEREFATAGLVSILSNVKLESPLKVSARQKQILYGVLRDADVLAWPTHRDVEFVVAVVAAVGMVGDARAIPLMTRLADSCKQKEVRESAARLLPVLKGRLGEACERGNLLSPAVTLLRSALPASETNLLRTVDAQEEREI